MGLTLVVGFTLWIVTSVLVFCLVKRKQVDDKFRIMVLFLYYPGRLSLLVWAPWLGYRAGNDQGNATENLTRLANFEMVNGCVDIMQKYNTASV